MVGLKPPPTGEMMDNNGKPIYFDSIDNSAYILGKAEHSARDSWIYIDGENFLGVRADIGGDPKEPWLKIAWKYLYTAKDTWLGATAEPRRHRRDLQPHDGPLREVRHDLQRRSSTRVLTIIAGQVRGQGQRLGLVAVRHPLIDFDKSIVKYPNIKRSPGGASNDLVPNLKDPANPVPYDPIKVPKTIGGQ